MAAFETDPITGLREFWGRLLVRPDALMAIARRALKRDAGLPGTPPFDARS